MKIYTESRNLLLKHKLSKIFDKILFATNNTDLNFAVGLNFVNANEIQALNKEHRQTDKVTDVLSFPMFETQVGKKISESITEIDKLESEIYLGDIVICKDKVYTQAKEYNIKKSKEMVYLAVHSFLHLLGYDHMTQEDEKEMFDFAEKILGYGR